VLLAIVQTQQLGTPFPLKIHNQKHFNPCKFYQMQKKPYLCTRFPENPVHPKDVTAQKRRQNVRKMFSPNKTKTKNNVSRQSKKD
jgi:hypothetical protein